MQRLRNVLADEGLFLQTVDVANDLLRIAHGEIMIPKQHPRDPKMAQLEVPCQMTPSGGRCQLLP